MISMQQKFLEKTLGQQIADMAAKYPDDNMIDYTDRDYSRTWKEFNDECETIARGFMALGLKRVHIFPSGALMCPHGC